ncbi:unnamed protein product, partial [Dibothriocephalus latus]
MSSADYYHYYFKFRLSSKVARQFTRVIPQTNNPVWVHTFAYNDFAREDVNAHELEVAVFDSNNDHVALVGEVLIDLSVADLSGRAYWYPIPQVWNSRTNPESSSRNGHYMGIHGYTESVQSSPDETARVGESWTRSVYTYVLIYVPIDNRQRRRPVGSVDRMFVSSSLVACSKLECSGSSCGYIGVGSHPRLVAVNKLLKFCLKTYFTFNETIYEQVKGTPVGSPISGLIVEAILQQLESLVFRHHRPKFSAWIPRFTVSEDDQSFLSDGSEVSEFSDFSKLSLQSPPANSG